ncbi:MAG: hypothetical protein QOK25_248 [Thermoleophilaceae bacterium]|nr:hypothetical protein [Thermoleophilaceae bacterium]
MATAPVDVAVPTQDQLADFARDGFLVVRDAIPSEVVDRLLDASDRLMSSPADPAREDHPEFGIRGYREPLLRADELLDVLAPPTIVPLVVGVLGPNICLTGSELIYTDSPLPIRTPESNLWHRDRKVLEPDLAAAIPRMSLKSAYYLTDVSSPDAGMTLFAPGSHRLAEPLHIEPDAIDPRDVVRPDVRPGDAVLFEHRTWHCQGFNGSGRVRKALFVEYGYRWLRRRFRDSSIPERLMAGRGPVERQLLGDLGPDPSYAQATGRGSNAIEEWCEEHGVPRGPLRDG